MVQIQLSYAPPLVCDVEHTNGGGFGFNLFAGSTTFDPQYYQSGENENIIFLEKGTYKIEIAISLGGNSINPEENMISPLFINIYKQ